MYGEEKGEEGGVRRAARSEPPRGLSPCDRELTHGWGPELLTVLTGWCVGVCELECLQRCLPWAAPSHQEEE